MVNTCFQVFHFVASRNSPTVVCMFSWDAEDLDIGNRDSMLCWSSLTENVGLLDTQERGFKNAISDLLIPWSFTWITSVPVLDLYLKPLENGEIVLIIDASKRYSPYATSFESEQVARLPEHTLWDNEVPLLNPHAMILTAAVYETTWEGDVVLWKYLAKHLPIGTVSPSRLATGALILFVCQKDESLTLVVD